jgi:membrane protein YqaA with SNARE-associated domain
MDPEVAKQVDAGSGKKPNAIKRLYLWMLSYSEKPNAPKALAGFSFAESIFFPIPPDVLLIPMCLGARSKAFYFALVCTVASVVGGMIGYALGMFMAGPVEVFLCDWLHQRATWDRAISLYNEWGFAAVLIAGFTPIPFKVFTVTAGIAAINFPGFVLAAFIGRAGRFFLVAALLWKWGEPIKRFIDNWFNLLSVLMVVGIVGGFVAVKYLAG